MYMFSYCIYCVHLPGYSSFASCPVLHEEVLQSLTVYAANLLHDSGVRLRKSWKCNSLTGSDRKHTDHSSTSLTHYCTVHIADSRRKNTVLLHPLDRYTAWESWDTARQEERKIKDTHIWCRAFICSRTGEGDKLMTALMHHKTANWERDRETKTRKSQLESGEQWILD